jgi:TrmH family RNA methyltransferase
VSRVKAIARRAPRVIASRANPRLAEYRTLARRTTGSRRILLDGVHLLHEARRAGLSIKSAAFTADALKSPDAASEADGLLADDVDVITVPPSVMSSISPVRSSSGVVAIAELRVPAPDEPFVHPKALVVAGADVQDPGNVGALIRSAEAGGATGVVLTGQSACPFSWKALRGSMGGAFRLPVIAESAIDDAIARAKQHKLRVLVTTSRGGRPPFDVELTRPTMIIVGNEGAGLPDRVLNQADQTVSIPMRDGVDSLNVAVAAALIVYEAYRQRRPTS